MPILKDLATNHLAIGVEMARIDFADGVQHLLSPFNGDTRMHVESQLLQPIPNLEQTTGIDDFRHLDGMHQAASAFGPCTAQFRPPVPNVHSAAFLLSGARQQEYEYHLWNAARTDDAIPHISWPADVIPRLSGTRSSDGLSLVNFWAKQLKDLEDFNVSLRLEGGALLCGLPEGSGRRYLSFELIDRATASLPKSPHFAWANFVRVFRQCSVWGDVSISIVERQNVNKYGNSAFGITVAGSSTHARYQYTISGR